MTSKISRSPWYFWFAILSVVALSGLAAPARAQDTIKVAVGQIDAWSNQVPTLGMKAGIFQKHGIVLDNYGTQGAGETLQAVISGSADIGIGVGTSGAMRAFSKGAPVRVLAAAYTGVEDIYWFVPANSPIKKRKRHKRQAYDRLFDQWVDVRQRLAGADDPLQSQSEAHPDRRTSCDVHNGHVGTGRHWLVGSAVWPEGTASQDHPRADAR